MTEPNDRELEDYMKGGSKLSRKYRDASRETAPPELDDKILAQARAEVAPRRRRVGRPLFSGLALAASLLLAVNLGWNVYRAKPQVGETFEMKDIAEDKGFVPNPPEPAPVPAPKPQRGAGGAADLLAERDARIAHRNAMNEARKKEAEQGLALEKQRQEEAATPSEEARRDEAPRAPAPAAAMSRPPPMAYERSEAPAMAAVPEDRRDMAQAKAKPAMLSEPEKIDRLIAYIGALQDAKFVRNGTEYGPADAVSHLQLKRRNAGDRVKTAEDFIKYCASFSSMSGEAYLIRYADGRTRTAEDVLREELARINAGG